MTTVEPQRKSGLGLDDGVKINSLLFLASRTDEQIFGTWRIRTISGEPRG
jgi:hypothetical protein